MWMIAEKEFKELLYSPKYLILFLVSSVIIFISIYNGYLAYQSEMNEASISEKMYQDSLEKTSSYHAMTRTIHRKPDILSIFDSGISGIIGRKSWVASTGQGVSIIRTGPSIWDARYTADPVLALFGELDLTFTVVMLISLFAFLLSFNMISGERENGTLSQIFSTSIKRSSVYLGKLAGGSISLALLLVIPFLIGLLVLLLLTDIHISPLNWLKIGLLLCSYLLYLLLFFIVGLTASTLCRNSFVSFMMCLLIWVVSIAIIPKAAIQIAAQISPSMSTQEFKERQEIHERELRKKYAKKRIDLINAGNFTQETWREKSSELYEQIRTEQEEERKVFIEQLTGEYQRQRINLAQTAVYISRASPTSSLSFSVHGLAGTGHTLLEEFENSVAQYQRSFHQFAEGLRTEHKEEIERERRSWRRSYEIKPDENGYMRVTIFSQENDRPTIDLRGMPEYQGLQFPLEAVLSDTFVDLMLIAVYTIIMFVIGYVAFLRYDVRWTNI